MRSARLKKSLISGASQIVASLAGEPERYSCCMITLTYRDYVEWSPLHISEFQQSIYRYLHRLGVRYRAIWVLELTRRNRPHYHLLVWVPRSRLVGRVMPKPDYLGWWPHGMTNRQWSHSPVGYLVKYASKFDPLSKPPHGARLHGVRGLTGTFLRAHRLHMLPSWIKEKTGPQVLSKRLQASDGHWLTDQGELVRSPNIIVARSKDWTRLQFGPRPDSLVLPPD
jgi:hypothetical protein